MSTIEHEGKEYAPFGDGWVTRADASKPWRTLKKDPPAEVIARNLLVVDPEFRTQRNTRIATRIKRKGETEFHEFEQ